MALLCRLRRANCKCWFSQLRLNLDFIQHLDNSKKKYSPGLDITACFVLIWMNWFSPLSSLLGRNKLSNLKGLFLQPVYFSASFSVGLAWQKIEIMFSANTLSPYNCTIVLCPCSIFGGLEGKGENDEQLIKHQGHLLGLDLPQLFWTCLWYEGVYKLYAY